MGVRMRLDLFSSEISFKDVANIQETGKRRINPEDITISNKKARRDLQISCICKLPYDEGNMICCNHCQAQQHKVCIRRERKEIPDVYFCGGCIPPSLNNPPRKTLQQNAKEIPNYKENTTDKLIKMSSTKVNEPESEKTELGKTLSNNMKDAVQTTCKICHNTFTLTSMRSHTKKSHNMAIRKYREVYGQLELIKHIYHKCGLCSSVMIIDSDTIMCHLRVKHRISHASYNAQFMITSRNKQKEGYRQKKSTTIISGTSSAIKESDAPTKRVVSSTTPRPCSNTTNTAVGIFTTPGPITTHMAGVTSTPQRPSKTTPARTTATTPVKATLTTKEPITKTTVRVSSTTLESSTTTTPQTVTTTQQPTATNTADVMFSTRELSSKTIEGVVFTEDKVTTTTTLEVTSRAMKKFAICGEKEVLNNVPYHKTEDLRNMSTAQFLHLLEQVIEIC